MDKTMLIGVGHVHEVIGMIDKLVGGIEGFWAVEQPTEEWYADIRECDCERAIIVADTSKGTEQLEIVMKACEEMKVKKLIISLGGEMTEETAKGSKYMNVKDGETIVELVRWLIGEK